MDFEFRYDLPLGELEDVDKLESLVARTVNSLPDVGGRHSLADVQRIWDDYQTAGAPVHFGFQGLGPASRRGLTDFPVVAVHENFEIVAILKSDQKVRWTRREAEA